MPPAERKALLKAVKLNSADKAAIMHDDRFLDEIDATLFDALFGIRDLSRSENRILSLVLQRLGLTDSRKRYTGPLPSTRPE